MTHPIDIAIGQRLRIARNLRGFSEKALGEYIGISEQKMKEYEVGEEPLPVSILCDIAGVFDISLLDFFKDMDALKTSLNHGIKLEAHDLELIERFRTIPCAESRSILTRLIAHLSEDMKIKRLSG